jgi:hypothetical protein
MPDNTQYSVIYGKTVLLPFRNYNWYNVIGSPWESFVLGHEQPLGGLADSELVRELKVAPYSCLSMGLVTKWRDLVELKF